MNRPPPSSRSSSRLAVFVAALAAGAFSPPPAAAARASVSGVTSARPPAPGPSAPCSPTPAATAPIYRCGTLYTQAPCQGAVLLHVDDPRNAVQRHQAEDAAARDKRLAATLEAERRRREQPPPARLPRHGAPCAPARAASAPALTMAAYGAPNPEAITACPTPRRHPPSAARHAATRASEVWKASVQAAPRAAGH